MPTAKFRTKRFFELTQLVLSFVSVCAVVEASWIHPRPDERAGYYASGPLRNDVRRDRLMADLARTERKRREAELQQTLQQRQLGA